MAMTTRVTRFKYSAFPATNDPPARADDKYADKPAACKPDPAAGRRHGKHLTRYLMIRRLLFRDLNGDQVPPVSCEVFRPGPAKSRRNQRTTESTPDPCPKGKNFPAGASEQPDDPAFVGDVDGVGARHLRQSRHGHDISADQHDEFRARRQSHFANRQHMVVRCAAQLRIG